MLCLYVFLPKKKQIIQLKINSTILYFIHLLHSIQLYTITPIIKCRFKNPFAVCSLVEYTFV